MSFLEAAGAEVKIGLNLKSTTIIKVSLSKSVKRFEEHQQQDHRHLEIMLRVGLFTVINKVNDGHDQD